MNKPTLSLFFVVLLVWTLISYESIRTFVDYINQEEVTQFEDKRTKILDSLNKQTFDFNNKVADFEKKVAELEKTDKVKLIKELDENKNKVLKLEEKLASIEQEQEENENTEIVITKTQKQVAIKNATQYFKKLGGTYLSCKFKDYTNDENVSYVVCYGHFPETETKTEWKKEVLCGYLNNEDDCRD